jgi:hypothetical protein
VPLDLSGLVNTTVALRDFGQMSTWRAGARIALKRLIKIYDVIDLDDDAQAYRQVICDTFLGGDPANRSYIQALLVLAPGDWRVKGEYQWKRVGTETADHVLELLDEYLIPLFWGRAPWEFPRNRWTGANKTFRDIGVPTCVHEVQEEVMVEWRKLLNETLPRRVDVAPMAALADLSPRFCRLG